MKALPFPCIRPAQDRVLEALPAMGGILSGNDALRGAIADGLPADFVVCGEALERRAVYLGGLRL